MNHLTNHPLNCSTAQMLNFLPSPLYICRESSTNSPLFMQNKPNFLDTQMNISSVLTKYYENNLCSGLLENKPNSKPIKPNTNPIQSQSKPIQSQSNPIQIQFLPKIRKNLPTNQLSFFAPVPFLFLWFSPQPEYPTTAGMKYAGYSPVTSSCVFSSSLSWRLLSTLSCRSLRICSESLLRLLRSLLVLSSTFLTICSSCLSLLASRRSMASVVFTAPSLTVSSRRKLSSALPCSCTAFSKLTLLSTVLLFLRRSNAISCLSNLISSAAAG